MPRTRLCALLALAAAGCAAELEYVDPAPVRVSVAPPPARYEAPLACAGGTWVGGHWAWRGGGWRWRGGRCVGARPGYLWVSPRYEGGVYYRGHWGRGTAPGYVAPPAAPGYVPPPAAAPGYVPPPAPAYR